MVDDDQLRAIEKALEFIRAFRRGDDEAIRRLWREADGDGPLAMALGQIVRDVILIKAARAGDRIEPRIN